MSGLIENIKAKIAEAKATMAANAAASYTEALTAEVEAHITEMDTLLREVETKGQSDDELKRRVGESINKLEVMLRK